jgi:hypothetical protein
MGFVSLRSRRPRTFLGPAHHARTTRRAPGGADICCADTIGAIRAKAAIATATIVFFMVLGAYGVD